MVDSATAKLVYAFSDPEVKEPKAVLGGKGAGLAEMTRLGIPVPPGLTIVTEACRFFYEHGGKFPEGLKEQVEAGLAATEREVGMVLGDEQKPLLLSVRSGARVSMPGMMDTILNLGLNDATVEGLAARTKDRRFAFDAYRRLLTMYSDVVLGVPREKFEHALTDLKKKLGSPSMPDPEVPAEALVELCRSYQKIVVEATGKPFPQDVREQLWGAIGAVFKSWMSKRAQTYRNMYGYPDTWGTAVNVQAMVFGNMGEDCATGVAFTRNPSTGEKKVYGEYLRNAQGEDVVAGIRTPKPLAAASAAPGREAESLEKGMPATYQELIVVFNKLESHFRDVQDIEFTIQQGKLWLLQTRNGKRTARAAVRIAVDMVGEKLISPEEAVLRGIRRRWSSCCIRACPSRRGSRRKASFPSRTASPRAPARRWGRSSSTRTRRSVSPRTARP
jgi:pyruvate, orthophosphate dikinase